MHIKNLWTTLSLIMKTLDAYSLGNAKDWKQMHNDETSRQQKSLVNIVMTMLDQDDNLKTICLSGSIITEDKSAGKQSRAIIGYFDEAWRLLKVWRETTLEIYPKQPELLDKLPNLKDMAATRLIGDMISHDNCPAANLTGKKIGDEIIQRG